MCSQRHQIISILEMSHLIESTTATTDEKEVESKKKKYEKNWEKKGWKIHKGAIKYVMLCIKYSVHFSLAQSALRFRTERTLV